MFHSRKLPDISFRDGYTEISLKIEENQGRHPRVKFCQLLRSNFESDSDLESGSSYSGSTYQHEVFYSTPNTAVYMSLFVVSFIITMTFLNWFFGKLARNLIWANRRL